MNELAADETPARAGSAADIHQLFRGLIASGQLGVGERLPTVRQTAADLGVAQATAAKAYRLLEQDGLIVTRTAAGSRVAPGAAALPAAVVERIRALVAAASDAGSDVDAVVDALRSTWNIRAGSRSS